MYCQGHRYYALGIGFMYVTFISHVYSFSNKQYNMYDLALAIDCTQFYIKVLDLKTERSTRSLPLLRNSYRVCNCVVLKFISNHNFFLALRMCTMRKQNSFHSIALQITLIVFQQLCNYHSVV